MPNQTPDVRVRLSAEGQAEVIKAFKDTFQTIQNDSKKTAAALEAINAELGGLTELMPQLTVAAAVAGFFELSKSALESAVNIGKLQQKTGITVETLSVFNFAAQQAGVDQEAMGKGLIKSVRFFDEYDKGAQKAKDAVKNLFGNSNALKGLSEDERVLKVTDALAKLEPGAKRTGAAMEIFGKSGADLLPMLDKLGDGGIEELRKKMEKLGLVMDEKLVAAADRAHESLKDLSALAQGAALQFVSGLAPSLANAAETVTADVSQGGVNGFQAVGKYAGYVINGIVAAFLIVGKTIAFVLEEGEQLWHHFGETAKDDLRGIWTVIKSQAGQQLTGNPLAFLNAKDLKNLDGNSNQFMSRLKAFMDDTQKTVGKLFDDPKPVDKKKGKHEHSADDEENEKSLKSAQLLAEATRKLTEAQLNAELAILKAKNKQEEDEDKRKFNQGLLSVEKYYKDRAERINADSDKEIAILKEKAAAIQKAIDFESTRKLRKGETAGDRQKSVLGLQGDLAGVNAQVTVARINRDTSLNANSAEQLNATRELAKAQLDAEAQIATAQGRRFDAEQKHLEAEVAGLQRLKDESDAAFAARQSVLLDTGTQKINFDKISEQGKLAIESLATARQQINDKVSAGQLDQLNAEDQLRSIEQGRLPNLQQIAAAMQAAAITPEQQQSAAQFAENVNQIGIASNKASQQQAQFKAALEDGINSGILNFLTELGDGTHSVGDAFKSMAGAIVQSLEQAAAKMLTTMITMRLMKALFGGGAGFSGGGEVDASGGVNAAEGGHVTGPGTGTSDSIAARLSDGEYVVRSAVVAQPGMLGFLHSLNNAGGNVRRRGRGFAQGGLVDGTGSTAQGAIGHAGITATLGLDEGLVLKKLAASPEWDRVHVKTAERNAKAVKSVLGA